MTFDPRSPTPAQATEGRASSGTSGVPARRGNQAWQPGVSGNPKGRPQGARGKLQEKFLLALHDDFNLNGNTAIQAARLKDPLGYLKLIRSLFPSNLKIDASEEMKKFMNLVAEGGYNITEGPNGPMIELEAQEYAEDLLK